MEEVLKVPTHNGKACSVLALLLIVSCVLFPGCAGKRVSRSVDPAYPPELASSDCQQAMIQAVEEGVSDGCAVKKIVISAVKRPSATDQQKEALRNRYIDQTVISINQNYRNFKDAYYVGQASFDSLSDFALLALSGITAVAGGAPTKAALGAASAGITGAHASVQKNFFENNARDAIFTMMDTLRGIQLAKIDQSKQLTIAQYSMGDALRDLDLYYEMGTVLKAQQTIYAAASAASNESAATPSAAAPTITTQPTNQTITQGESATLSVAVAGVPPLTFQWYQGASGDTSKPVNGATSSSFTTGPLASNASYWVRVANSTGHVDSSAASVTVNASGAPAITAQPASQVIAAGQSATLAVAAVGTPAPTYQWYEGTSGDVSNAIAGATNNTFTTSNAGSYWVRVTNSGGHVDSAAAGVTVTPAAAGPPQISTQPTSQTITTGQTANLSVAATGNPPLSYQWYQGSSGITTTAIGGANQNTLATTNAGTYWVRVTNSAGHSDSQAASVTVIAAGAPVITTQPADQVISSGQSATLSVTAVGTAPLAYQWYQGASGDTHNPEANGIKSTFTTPALTASGTYWVRVSNAAGHADSATVSVKVNVPVAAAAPLQGSSSLAAQGTMTNVVNVLSKSIQSQGRTAAH